jgi:hypothetical protein
VLALSCDRLVQIVIVCSKVSAAGHNSTFGNVGISGFGDHQYYRSMD